MQPDFNPTAPEQVLDALAEPGATPSSVARHFNTSTPALARWLASPEILQLVADLEAAAALQIRLRALRSLHLAVTAVERVLADPPSPSASLRAASLLLRLSTLQQPRPQPAKPRHPPSSDVTPHLSAHHDGPSILDESGAGASPSVSHASHLLSANSPSPRFPAPRFAIPRAHPPDNPMPIPPD